MNYETGRGVAVKQSDDLFISFAVAELDGERTGRADAIAELLEAALEQLPEGHPVREAAVHCARAILGRDEHGNALNQRTEPADLDDAVLSIVTESVELCAAPHGITLNGIYVALRAWRGIGYASLSFVATAIDRLAAADRLQYLESVGCWSVRAQPGDPR